MPAIQNLIDAILSKHDANITLLLNASDLDVNAIGKFDSYFITPLGAAILIGNLALVKKLLAKGAKIDPNVEVSNHYPGCYVNALTAFARNKDVSARNLTILPLLLAKAENLNPEYSGENGPTMKNLLDFLNVKERWTKWPKDAKEYLELITHEAILRNDQNLISKVFEIENNIRIDEQSMQKYLENRELPSAAGFYALQAIDYLIKNQYVLSMIGAKIKSVIQEKTDGILSLPNLPTPLMEHFKDYQSTRSLKELFAEFRHYFCPEERLPKWSLDFQTGSTVTSHYSINEMNRIRSLQDPLQLRQLLSDPTEILLRLHACATINGTNPAVLLLTEIFVYKKDEKIMIEGKEEPLLNAKFQEIISQILGKLYSLTEQERLRLSLYKQQSDISSLKEQNFQLKGQVQILNEKIDTLTNQNQQILGLLRQSLKRPNELTVETQKQDEPKIKFF